MQHRIFHGLFLTHISLFLFVGGMAVHAQDSDGTRQLSFDRKSEGHIEDKQWVKDLWERYDIPENEHLLSNSEKFRVMRWRKGDYLLLRVEERGNDEDYHYMFFRVVQDEWNCLGHFNVFYQKDDPPTRTLVTIRGRDFLVVRSLSMSGAGVAFWVDTWWFLGKNEMRKVSRIPAKGSVLGRSSGFTRKFTSETEIVEGTQTPVNVAYHYTFQYWPVHDSFWSTPAAMQFQLVGHWLLNPEEATLQPDRERSGVTRKGIKERFNQGADGFVEDHKGELKAIELNARTRGWLRSLVEHCNNEDNRKALRKMLGGADEKAEAD